MFLLRGVGLSDVKAEISLIRLRNVWNYEQRDSIEDFNYFTA